MKKLFLATLTLTIVIFSSIGCMARAPLETTQEIWNDSKESVDSSYTDVIVSFYSDKKGEKLVFLGEKYHYLFVQDAKGFSKLLKAKEFLNLQQKNFHVEASLDSKDNRKVNLNMSAVLPLSGLNLKQKEWLREDGFLLRKSHLYVGQEPDPLYASRPVYQDIPVYYKSFFMNGTRYIANREVNKKSVKLIQARRLTVTGYKYQDKSLLKKIAMTPLALVGDAASDIVVVGVNLLLLPLFLIVK